jgi:hypothetical protein
MDRRSCLEARLAHKTSLIDLTRNVLTLVGHCY